MNYYKDKVNKELKMIPLFKIYSDKKDVEAVSSVIRRGSYWAAGPEINEFERKIAKYINAKFTVAFNSGTTALHALLDAYDIKGKEVIVPSFTFISTASSVILAGGKCVFAESESDTFGLDANDVKKKITKNTKAIIALHYAGLPSRDILKLRRLAKIHKLVLIEDAAESLGAKTGKNMVGNIGDAAIISFCQNKVITTGEGGMAATNSREIYEKLKLIRSHGRIEKLSDYFSDASSSQYVMIGSNLRMPTLCAALGLSQFAKINKIIAKRRRNTFYLIKKIYNNNNYLKVLLPKKNDYAVFQMFTIILSSSNIRNKLQKYLIAKGIMCKVYFNPVHLEDVYRKTYGFSKGDLPITENFSSRVLTLPLYPHMKKTEVDYIALQINHFFKRIYR